MPLERRCFALDLVSDSRLIAEYEARHAPGAVWPEILADMRDRGIAAMEIWRCADRLFMIAEIESDHSGPDVIPPIVRKWEAEMDRYQRHLPGTPEGTKWRAMTRIFDLAGQRAAHTDHG
ncbi:L-fucose mutarotase [Asaia sp. W19]|uniref:L-rhamnose mutarotase n=1 Tax=unclassified Asaia TaxID=2685023 RepID=UPI000F8E0C34|nr:L-rhamnose mutarotase [Asaia sp. W19]RUT25232.1 L-fucose mutarotase [Asaia sp. W19]